MSLPKTMRAAQLGAYHQPLENREVPVLEPQGENVLIRIAGSGLCHSDSHLMSGEVPLISSFPFTLGHENTGTIVAVGKEVRGFQIGDPVVVFGGWSTHSDRFTRSGLDQLSEFPTCGEVSGSLVAMLTFCSCLPIVTSWMLKGWISLKPPH